MKITNVRVYPNPKPGTLRAYVDITLDDCLSIRELRLITCNGRYMLCMPNVVQKDGSLRTVAYASDHKMLKVIEDAVIAEYKKVTRATVRSKRRVWLPT
jgi:stage V sporulation protein G